MIIKFFFEKEGDVIPFNNQDAINGIVYGRILKGDKGIHDSFSPYAISSIQGCFHSKNENGLRPYQDQHPYIQVSSRDISFIERFACGIEDEIDKQDKVFFGRRIIRYETLVFEVGDDYDVIKTISPVLVQKQGKRYLSKDDGWKKVLFEKCVKKLSRDGISDDTFRIEFNNMNNVKDKTVYVHNRFSQCISFVCVVYGRPETRKCLYELGIGGSTGSGFGSVNVLGNKK